MKRFTIVILLNLFIICFFTGCSEDEKIIQSNSYPPNVTIAYPLDGSTVSEIVTITCMATGSTPIKKVTLWVDGFAVTGAIDADEPFELQWNTVGYEDSTNHTIIARALDEVGNQMDSDPIQLIVDNSSARPLQIELQLIRYINGTFQIQWPMSKDDDFNSYTLYEALDPNLSDEKVIFTSTVQTDTSYVVNGVTQGEFRFYRLIVVDTLSLQTSSSVQTARALEILFSDDFSGVLSQWEVSKGTWHIYDGKLRGEGHGGNIDAWIYAGDESWTDYEVSFTAYFETGNAEIVLRSTGHWQDEYRISIYPREFGMYSNVYMFAHYKNGQPYVYPDSLGFEHRAYPFLLSNPLHIRLSIVSNEVKLYINNKYLDSIIDPDPLPAGRFGLGIIWTGITYFDNVVVWKL